MDGILPFPVSAPPAAPAAGAAAPGEAAGEGGFSDALNRSMANPLVAATGSRTEPLAGQAGAVPPVVPGAVVLPTAPTAVTAAALPGPMEGLGVAPPPGIPVDAPELVTADPAATALAATELAGLAPGLVSAQAISRPKPAMAAISDLPAPLDAALSPELAEGSPDLLPAASPGLPSGGEAPAKPTAPARDEGAEGPPIEANPLLVPAAAAPLLSMPSPAASDTPAASLSSSGPPAGLSASAPQAGPGPGFEAPPMPEGIAAAPPPDSEGDSAPPEAPPPEHAHRLVAERAPPPPPNLTTSLWQAEALAPLSGFDLAAVARPLLDIVAAPVAPAAAPPPPPAARQVASVAVALAFAPNGTGGFNLSLDPVELGRVEIRVQREGDTHTVRVTAERPETLALLQRDRHELDRNLTDAGLRIDAGGIAFSLEGHSPDGGAGQRDGQREAQREAQRGLDGGRGRATAMNEAEAPPPRLTRSLLDLNI